MDEFAYGPVRRGSSLLRVILLLGIAVLAMAQTASAMRDSRASAMAAATKFTVVAAATSVADANLSVTVTAVDGTGATDASYVGSVTLTTTDPNKSGLPVAANLVAGVHVFTVKLETGGSQKITATAAGLTGTSGAIAVTPGAAATLKVSVPAVSVVGQSVSAKVSALDAGGNVATGYVGTVYFTSSDTAASLPDDYTFVAGDKGVHTFTTVALMTAATSTVSATDTVTGTITGTSGNDVVTAGTVTHFSVTVPATAQAGVAVNATVTALNASNALVPGYVGTVHITSSDTKATLPADAALVAGVGVFSVTLKTAGDKTISAKAVLAAYTGSGKVTVLPDATASFGVTVPATSTIGQAVDVKVSALDAGGNVDPTFTGPVTFTSSDGAAVLPAVYTFVSADNGVHTFKVTLLTAQTSTVTATDGGVTGTSGNDVVATGAVTHFGVTGPATNAADATLTVIVTALNAYNVKVATNTDTVHFTTSDANATKPAVIPADTALVAGTKTFAAVVLETLGSQTITAQDVTTASVKSGTVKIAVTPGPAATLKVTAATSTTAGQKLPTVKVTALDAGGNTATGYGGIATFTSTDGAAVLPANYTFVAGDNGVHVFSGVRLLTVGSKTVTATDTVTGSITGTSAAVTVNAGTATHFKVVLATATEVADVAKTATVTALNAFDGVVTNYAGIVHFTSSDKDAFKAVTLPADYTFVSGDAGVKVFAAGVKLEGAGRQSVTVTDTAKASVKGTGRITVLADVAKTLKVTMPKYTVSGAWTSVTVTALDVGGNVDTTYTGIVHFTLGGAGATLPANYTFTTGGGNDNGTHTFTIAANVIKLTTAGNQTVHAQDTVTASIAGTSGNIWVH